MRIGVAALVHSIDIAFAGVEIPNFARVEGLSTPRLRELGGSSGAEVALFSFRTGGSPNRRETGGT